jgi:uncharacterized membrane protein (DUF4010 family)
MASPADVHFPALQSMVHDVAVSIGGRFMIAIVLGMLVGLERSRSSLSHPERPLAAGVRTFTLLSGLGFACACLAQAGYSWMLPAGFLAVCSLAGLSYIHKQKSGAIGYTSEVAVMLIYIIGALTLLADLWIPLSLGIVGTLLLSDKEDIEGLVKKLNDAELLAVVKFLFLTVVVLPILPDQSFTRFEINPVTVWKLIILISSISFLGYILCKKFGGRFGLWLSGLMGGLVSSTAVSVSMGKLASKGGARAGNALRANLLGTSVSYLRVGAYLSALAPALMPMLWWRFALLALIGVVLAILVKAPQEKPVGEGGGGMEVQNPFELKPALVFGGLFVLLTVVTELAATYVGLAGIYALGFAAGFVQVDSFILSVIRETLGQQFIVGAVVIAMLGNSFSNGLYFCILGKPVRREGAIFFGIWSLCHIPLIFL